MFHPEENEYESAEALNNHFATYCEWCWGSGYGNCDICMENKKKAEEMLKGDKTCILSGV